MRFTEFITAAALVAASTPALSETLAGPYEAHILRVIDGDTVEARVHIWLGLDVTTGIRLRGIDTAELRGPCPQAARDARDMLAKLIGTGPVTLTRITPDKYGSRVDATMLLPSGTDASAAMRAAGHASTCPGRK